MAKARGGFTLVELLITITIIGILAGMMLFAMFQSQETAKAHRTRALIAKLNSIIMRRYDEYKTRRVPIQFLPAEITAGPNAMAKIRVDCLRDLMRMEMPDRWSDVLDNPVTPLPPTTRTAAEKLQRPAASQAYLTRYAAIVGNTTWPIPPPKDVAILNNQGAECLYLIVMESLAQEGDARDFFKAGDVGDTDGDGFMEFLDAWDRPIEFIRWAPGFQSPLQTPIRLKVAISQDDPHTATVSVLGNDGPRLSQTPGSYVGGSLSLVDTDSKIIDTRSMAKVSGYRYDATTFPPTVIFTCKTPSTTGQAPFDGFQSADCEILVSQPDPFDARGVYPIYNTGAGRPTPDTSIPTYAIYPLVYSRGKDRASGIVDDVGGVLRYASGSVGLNPYFIQPPASEPFGLMLGSVPRSSSEPGWYYGCHLDNITSHDEPSR